MKSNSEETRANNFVHPWWSGLNPFPSEPEFKILNISENDQIHYTVNKTLKHFSLIGKKLAILKASSLQEAKTIAANNPDLILVVIDNDSIINGSYHELKTFIREDLKNQVCYITLKKDLINSPVNDVPIKPTNEDNKEFEFAREKLIDIIRMIMLTFEMESKTKNKNLIDLQKDNKLENTNNQEVKSDSITREQLYTILAHDLQGPVGNIKVMLDFLTNEQDLLDDKTSKELLLSIKDSANSIHELLENLSFWTRLHKHEINFNPVRFSLAHLVRENLTLLKSAAVRKKIKLSSNIDENTEVFADEYMITTVLRNLVYNAIKFTKRGGIISVFAKEEKKCIKIEVSDTGIGIPAQDIEKLFQPDVYFKTKGTAKESGTGLGLILCKDFIEKNGGKIKVISEEGKGSTFSFTLPKWSAISIS